MTIVKQDHRFNNYVEVPAGHQTRARKQRVRSGEKNVRKIVLIKPAPRVPRPTPGCFGVPRLVMTVRPGMKEEQFISRPQLHDYFVRKDTEPLPEIELDDLNQEEK